MREHIILAYVFDGVGGGTAFTGDAVSAKIAEKDSFAWVHLDASHPDTKLWLEREVSYLDPFIIEALIAEESRPRLVHIDDGALLILRGVNPNKSATPEDMVSIRLWFDENRVISLRKRKIGAVADMEKKVLAGKGPRNAGHFIGMLISLMFERMEPVLTDLSEETDDIEEQVAENAGASLRESIVDVRKKAIMLRRYLAPQRDELGQLRMSDLDILDDMHRRQLQECYNHAVRHVEDLDAIRERAQIVKDEISNLLADRLNKNMYILSVIAAVFLPLGFLTGLLGINVGGIPGAENDAAFWVFCAMLVAIVAFQVFLFKKLKWF